MPFFLIIRTDNVLILKFIEKIPFAITTNLRTMKKDTCTFVLMVIMGHR